MHMSNTTQCEALAPFDAFKIGETTFWIIVSFVTFRMLQLLVRWYLYRKWTFKTFNFFEFVRHRRILNRPFPIDTALDVVPPNKKWRNSNEIVSLIHSAISGFWALYVLMAFLDKFKSECGLITYENPIAQYLVLLSFGYLAEDFMDLVINERSVRIIELLFHHVVVIIAFMVTLVSRRFLGIVVIGLLMEVNSIFLHTRSLMNLNGVKKNSYSFRLIALLNISSFILFRMVVSIFLVVWQFLPTTLSRVPWYLTMINALVILSLFTTNTVLLYRVLAADGILGRKRARRHSHHSTIKHPHSHSHPSKAVGTSLPTTDVAPIIGPTTIVDDIKQVEQPPLVVTSKQMPRESARESYSSDVEDNDELSSASSSSSSDDEDLENGHGCIQKMQVNINHG